MESIVSESRVRKDVSSGPDIDLYDRHGEQIWIVRVLDRNTDPGP